MKMKAADIAVIVIVAAVIILFTAFSLKASTGKKQLLIESAKGSYLYSLDTDQMIHIDGPLGATDVEIKDGGVQVVDSPCRDKLCIADGYLSKPGDWTACLPNMVFLRIIGSENEEDIMIDDVSF